MFDSARHSERFTVLEVHARAAAAREEQRQQARQHAAATRSTQQHRQVNSSSTQSGGLSGRWPPRPTLLLPYRPRSEGMAARSSEPAASVGNNHSHRRPPPAAGSRHSTAIEEPSQQHGGSSTIAALSLEPSQRPPASPGAMSTPLGVPISSSRVGGQADPELPPGWSRVDDHANPELPRGLPLSSPSLDANRLPRGLLLSPPPRLRAEDDGGHAPFATPSSPIADMGSDSGRCRFCNNRRAADCPSGACGRCCIARMMPCPRHQRTSVMESEDNRLRTSIAHLTGALGSGQPL